jgi:hypothetical protein
MSKQKGGAERQGAPKTVTSVRKVSKLGQRLRQLSDRALASGTDTLSNEEIHRLISEIRGRSA